MQLQSTFHRKDTTTQSMKPKAFQKAELRAMKNYSQILNSNQGATNLYPAGFQNWYEAMTPLCQHFSFFLNKNTYSGYLTLVAHKGQGS